MSDQDLESDDGRPRVGRADADADAIRAGADIDSGPRDYVELIGLKAPLGEGDPEADGAAVGSADAEADRQRVLTTSEKD